MKINSVIIADVPSAGVKAGENMAYGLQTQMGVTPWELHIHVRSGRDAREGRDTAYAVYTNRRAS